MTDAAGSSQKRWVEQDVLEFDNPDKAAQFVNTVGKGWRHCAHPMLKLDYPDRAKQWTFGDVSYSEDDGIVVVSSTVSGDPPSVCSHAVAAKSNVVSDVQVCGFGEATQATAIVHDILNKFPLWDEKRR